MITVSFTGLEPLIRNFGNSPSLIEKVIGQALGKSIAMVETESKTRTPVDTGLLRSSIGGAMGYSYVKGLTAGVGTNVKYAWAVHEGNGRHKVGERKFMEKGASAATPFITKQMEGAMTKLADELAKQ